MAIHSNILAWRIPQTEVSGGLYSPWDCEESDMTEQLTETQIKIKKKKKEYRPAGRLWAGGLECSNFDLFPLRRWCFLKHVEPTASPA